MQEPTDEELDALIVTRLRLIGVDLDVLPENDPSAPADRRRILASARRFLRGTVTSLSRFELDPQRAPADFPGLRQGTGAGGGRGA
jgi:hypothetical protein